MMFLICMCHPTIYSKSASSCNCLSNIYPFLLILPFTHMAKFRSLTFYPLNQLMFWSLVSIVFFTWIGARPVEDPYVITGQILTVLYFSCYIINPLTLMWWDEMLD